MTSDIGKEFFNHRGHKSFTEISTKVFRWSSIPLRT